jgi:hypothetical protein
MSARAKGLFREVHALARSYHWSEGEILRLGLGRRFTYLALLEEEADAANFADVLPDG